MYILVKIQDQVSTGLDEDGCMIPIQGSCRKIMALALPQYSQRTIKLSPGSNNVQFQQRDLADKVFSTLVVVLLAARGCIGGLLCNAGSPVGTKWSGSVTSPYSTLRVFPSHITLSSRAVHSSPFQNTIREGCRYSSQVTPPPARPHTGPANFTPHSCPLSRNIYPTTPQISLYNSLKYGPLFPQHAQS